MDKEEYYREKFQDEHYDDLKAEANRKTFIVEFKGKIEVETHDPQIAIEEAINRLNDEDIYDYISDWKAE
jgi:hypothetical protein